MEYLTDLVTTVPEGTSPVKVDELRAAEAVRAAELAKAGHLVRLWRPPLGPGEWRSIGLFRAADEAELREVLASLPLHIWMKVTIMPLTRYKFLVDYYICHSVSFVSLLWVSFYLLLAVGNDDALIAVASAAAAMILFVNSVVSLL
jgi:muconolactone D-isomerase